MPYLCHPCGSALFYNGKIFQLTLNQRVAGSNPASSTKIPVSMRNRDFFVLFGEKSPQALGNTHPKFLSASLAKHKRTPPQIIKNRAFYAIFCAIFCHKTEKKQGKKKKIIFFVKSISNDIIYSQKSVRSFNNEV